MCLKPNGKCGRIDKPKKAASPPPPVNEKITDECYLKSTKANLNHERSDND